MNTVIIIKTSLKVLRSNKNRTFLTMLGIVIGIAAVIVVMSVGAGAQSLIFNQITSVGSNLIGVLPGYSDENGPPASAMGITVTSLTAEDTQAIKKLKEIESATSYVRGVSTIQWQNQKTDATFVGTTSEYVDVESAAVELGQFLDSSHDKGIARVAVLGWQVAQDLFGREDPVGKSVKIKKENFRIIGVMEKRGTVAFENQDILIFIPLETAQKLLLGIKHISVMRGKVTDEKDVDAVIAQIRQILRERHDITGSKDDDFSIRAATQALDTLGAITDALKFFLAGIAAISLLVGGVGIMNIMLVAVNERTREIGLRKAIGATAKNIQYQFLTESVILTIIGGIIGIMIGTAISALVAFGAQYLGYNWDFVVTATSIILSVSVAGFIGILFGWYPAYRASNLDPVEALRYE
ncbi:MAG: ABC transporter permease [bacterium]|nr:ABC transporter permease [bacterium]